MELGFAAGDRVTLGISSRVKPILIIPALILFLACAHGSKPAPQKHYSLSGKVVSLDAKEQSAAIDAAAIPHFMEAMTMDYPIASKAEFATLHPGERITASVDVSDDGSYSLSQIKVLTSDTKK
jgi:Cu/Ag efflux protein CusF